MKVRITIFTIAVFVFGVSLFAILLPSTDATFNSDDDFESQPCSNVDFHLESNQVSSTNDDGFSNLPNPVISLILDKLSPKNHAAASVLSKDMYSFVSDDMPYLIASEHSLSVHAQLHDAVAELLRRYRETNAVLPITVDKIQTQRVITQLCIKKETAAVETDGKQELNASLNCCNVEQLAQKNILKFIKGLLPDHGESVVSELVLRQVLRLIYNVKSVDDSSSDPTDSAASTMIDVFNQLPEQMRQAAIESAVVAIGKYVEPVDPGFASQLNTYLQPSTSSGPPHSLSSNLAGFEPWSMCGLFSSWIMQLKSDGESKAESIRALIQLGLEISSHANALMYGMIYGDSDIVQILLKVTDASQELAPFRIGGEVIPLYLLGISCSENPSKEKSLLFIANVIFGLGGNPADLLERHLSNNTPIHQAIDKHHHEILDLYLTRLKETGQDIFADGNAFGQEIVQYARDKPDRAPSVQVINKFLPASL